MSDRKREGKGREMGKGNESVLHLESPTLLGSALMTSNARFVIRRGDVGIGWSGVGCQNASIVDRALVVLLNDLV